MKQKATFFEVFETKRKEFEDQILKEYNKKIELARDEAKEEIHAKQLNELYNAHTQQQTKLDKYSRFLIEINDYLKADKNETFESLFNLNISQLPKKEVSDVITNLAQLDAISKAILEIRNFTNIYRTVDRTVNTASQTGLQWKGGELEFVQLIYALYHAKYLTNQDDKITHLIAQVAKAFNHNLGKNWQINLSESVNKRNHDYEPKIFEKIKTSYSEYCEKQIENNKQKKPK